MQSLSGDKPWMPHWLRPHLQRSLKTPGATSGKPERPPRGSGHCQASVWGWSSTGDRALEVCQDVACIPGPHSWGRKVAFLPPALTILAQLCGSWDVHGEAESLGALPLWTRSTQHSKVIQALTPRDWKLMVWPGLVEWSVIQALGSLK